MRFDVNAPITGVRKAAFYVGGHCRGNGQAMHWETDAWCLKAEFSAEWLRIWQINYKFDDLCIV